jgi:hypothetical protein
MRVGAALLGAGWAVGSVIFAEAHLAKYAFGLFLELIDGVVGAWGEGVLGEAEAGYGVGEARGVSGGGGEVDSAGVDLGAVLAYEAGEVV